MATLIFYENWKALTVFSLLSLVCITVISALTGMWVLTAIPIGFLFGVFLEKADLCGSSAFSEVLLVKDTKKLLGLWAIIVVGMIGFAGLSMLGLVKLNPRPFLWASHIVGGIAFGMGIVLAGGCVSGCLFKTGQGNINSMTGLIGIPFGVAAIEYGPLHEFSKYLEQFVIKAGDGGLVTLYSLTGLPYGILALLFTLMTLVLVWRSQQKKQTCATVVSSDIIYRKDDTPLIQRIVTKSWKPWQAGIAIGVLGIFAYLSSAESGRNYPLGVTHGVLQTAILVTDSPVKNIYSKPPAPVQGGVETAPASDKAKPVPMKKIIWWLVLEVNALVLGAYVSARLSGKIRFIPRPPEQTVVAFFGGILLGAGAGISGACIVGNVMSGFALMSVGSIVFGVAVVIANWVTTFFYHMGGEMY